MDAIAYSVACVAVAALAWDATRRWIESRDKAADERLDVVRQLPDKVDELVKQVRNLGNKVALGSGRRT